MFFSVGCCFTKVVWRKVLVVLCLVVKWLSLSAVGGEGVTGVHGNVIKGAGERNAAGIGSVWEGRVEEVIRGLGYRER